MFFDFPVSLANLPEQTGRFKLRTNVLAWSVKGEETVLILLNLIGRGKIFLLIGALAILFRLLQSVNSKQKFIFLQKTRKKRNFCGQPKTCCPLLTDWLSRNLCQLSPNKEKNILEKLTSNEAIGATGLSG